MLVFNQKKTKELVYLPINKQVGSIIGIKEDAGERIFPLHFENKNININLRK